MSLESTGFIKIIPSGSEAVPHITQHDIAPAQMWEQVPGWNNLMYDSNVRGLTGAGFAGYCNFIRNHADDSSMKTYVDFCQDQIDAFVRIDGKPWSTRLKEQLRWMWVSMNPSTRQMLAGSGLTVTGSAIAMAVAGCTPSSEQPAIVLQVDENGNEVSTQPATEVQGEVVVEATLPPTPEPAVDVATEAVETGPAATREVNSPVVYPGELSFSTAKALIDQDEPLSEELLEDPSVQQLIEYRKEIMRLAGYNVDDPNAPDYVTFRALSSDVKAFRWDVVPEYAATGELAGWLQFLDPSSGQWVRAESMGYDPRTGNGGVEYSFTLPEKSDPNNRWEVIFNGDFWLLLEVNPAGDPVRWMHSVSGEMRDIENDPVETVTEVEATATATAEATEEPTSTPEPTPIPQVELGSTRLNPDTQITEVYVGNDTYLEAPAHYKSEFVHTDEQGRVRYDSPGLHLYVNESNEWQVLPFEEVEFHGMQVVYGAGGEYQITSDTTKAEERKREFFVSWVQAEANDEYRQEIYGTTTPTDEQVWEHLTMNGLQVIDKLKIAFADNEISFINLIRFAKNLQGTSISVADLGLVLEYNSDLENGQYELKESLQLLTKISGNYANYYEPSYFAVDGNGRLYFISLNGNVPEDQIKYVQEEHIPGGLDGSPKPWDKLRFTQQFETLVNINRMWNSTHSDGGNSWIWTYLYTVDEYKRSGGASGTDGSYGAYQNQIEDIYGSDNFLVETSQ